MAESELQAIENPLAATVAVERYRQVVNLKRVSGLLMLRMHIILV